MIQSNPGTGIGTNQSIGDNNDNNKNNSDDNINNNNNNDNNNSNVRVHEGNQLA